MSTQREQVAAELAKYRKEYQSLPDDDIRAEMLTWKEHTPGYRAGQQILKERDAERDPTPKTIAELASRVANIEKHSLKHEFKTWSFWISIVSALIAAIALWVSYSQLPPSSHVDSPDHQHSQQERKGVRNRFFRNN